MRPVFTTSDALAAELAVEKLAAAGIDAWVQPGGGSFPGTSIDSQHKVIVRADQAGAALAVLFPGAAFFADDPRAAGSQGTAAHGDAAPVATKPADAPGPFTLPPLDAAGLWFALVVLCLPHTVWSVDRFFAPIGLGHYRSGDVAVDAACIMAVWFVAVRPAGSWRAVGLAPPRPGRDALVAILLLPPLFFWYVVGSPGLWQLLGSPTGLLPPYEMPAGALARTFELAALAVGLLCEELVYRGVLQPALTARCGQLSAIAIQAALFGLAHLYQGWFGAFSATGFGIVMGCGFALVQRLWPLWLVHYLLDLYLMGYL